MELTDLQLNRNLYKTQPQTAETLSADDVAANATPAPSTAIASGNSVTDINTNAEQINGDTIAPGTIPPSTLDIANFGWTQTCAFSVTDADTIAWGAGTFTSADGVNNYSIGAGNTGNMAASPVRTYVYLDINVSIAAYQISTSITAPVGIGKVLIAVCQAAIAPSVTATYALVQATQIVGDNVIANTISAEKMNVAVLSAITANMGSITAGTITGAVIQTSASGKRVVMNYSDNSLTFYDAVGQVIGIGTDAGNAFKVDLNATTTNGLLVSGSVAGFALTYVNSGNVVSYAVNATLSGASNTGAAFRFNNAGASGAYGILGTASNAATGMQLSQSGTGNAIEVINSGSGESISVTQNGTSPIVMDIAMISSGSNPTGIKMNTSKSGGGNTYAFEFAGSEYASSAVGGSNTKKVRVLIGGGVYYIPLYDA